MDNHDQEQGVVSGAGNSLREGMDQIQKEEIYAQALWRARIRIALYIHATLFAFVICLLVVINLLTTPRILWVVWPFFGWGLALLLHWLLGTKLLKLYDTIKTEEIARQLKGQGDNIV